MRALVITMLALAGLLGTARASAAATPSFDCAKASTAIEKAICSDDALAGLDRQMADTFREIQTKRPEVKDSLTAEQRDWLRARGVMCTTTGKDLVTCLTSIHQIRVEELKCDLTAPEVAAKSDTCVERAITRMPVDATRSEAVLRRATSTHGKLGLALLLRLVTPANAKPGEVAKLLGDTLKIALPKSEAMKDVVDPPKSYDGSTAGLVPYIQLIGGEDNFTIPCALLGSAPELLEATTSMFGGNRDNFLPGMDCNPQQTWPRSVTDYETTVEKVADARNAAELKKKGEDPATCVSEGTMRYAVYKMAEYQRVRITELPKTYLSVEKPEPANKIPPERELAPKFTKARDDLAGYYTKRFGMSADDARRAAHQALWAIKRDMDSNCEDQ